VLGFNQGAGRLAGKWKLGKQRAAQARVPLEVAIPGALRKNQEKLGPPDGPIADFIRLIKMKIHYIDGDPQQPSIMWVEGWGNLPEDNGPAQSAP
jgi:hypothetical protein